MEALQTHQPSSTPDQISEMDRRLEAIKEILVGNQLERLDRKYKGLNQRMESTSAHLISLVDDLSKEMVKLKKEQDQSLKQERKERFKENDNLRQDLHKVSNKAQEKMAAAPALSERTQRMARRIEELENLAQAFSQKQKEMAQKLRSEWKNDLSQRMEQQDKKNQASRNDMQTDLQGRLNNLEQSIDQKLSQQEDKVEGKIEQNQSKLQELASGLLGHQKRTDERLKNHWETFNQKIKASQGPDQKTQAELTALKDSNEALQRKTEEELYDIRQALYQNQSQQSELENELTQVMDKLASKVSQRLKKNDEEIKNLSKLLDESNKALAQAHHEQDQRIQESEDTTQELHKFLENELMPHLQASKEDRKKLDQKFDEMQAHFDQKLREVSARMEGRMDGMLQMKDQEQAKGQQAWQQRKKDIQGTLEKLSDLLDD